MVNAYAKGQMNKVHEIAAGERGSLPQLKHNLVRFAGFSDKCNVGPAQSQAHISLSLISLSLSAIAQFFQDHLLVWLC